MELWYSEHHTKGVKFSIQVREQISHAKSEFQEIDVFDSEDFGRFLTLDGYMMLTERDEFIYHEMIVHPAMMVHEQIERVLIIGAGDGGTVRELAKYPQVNQIDVVEIDPMVVAVCREHLKQTAAALDDPRVTLYYQDGLRFVRRQEGQYDLIIVDSTDPFGPAEGLFTKEFYGNCYKALNEAGILINQHESPFYPADAVAARRAHENIVATFPIAKVYQVHIPTYPSGHWLFGFASKHYDPIADHKPERPLPEGCRYYNHNLHAGAFALPTYVKQVLRPQG